RAVSMSPNDAPAMIATKRVGEVFEEFKTSSSVMIVLEGEQSLGADAHRFYDQMVRDLRADTTHVQHVQDFWGDPLTESGAQSTDGKATYVQVNLSGDMGETLANESIEAVRDIVKKLTTDEHGNPKAMPDGLKVYVTGAAALQADMGHAGDSSMLKITGLTFIVIIIMLLFFYRSIFTVLMVLLMVGIQLGAARGMISVLGDNHI
ncbi:MMPL family transporter, partial [Staphylococcus capitis]|nr:MMPL family transporter [Staphylococcus capitis]